MSGEERTCRRTADAVAFALHALEPGEEAALRTHLTGCPCCRATVADTELVAARLSVAVEQVDPPAGLRGSILVQAARSTWTGSRAGHRGRGCGPARARIAATGTARVPSEVGGARVPGPRRPPAGPVPGPGPGTTGAGRRRRVVAIVLVGVIGVVGVGGLAAHTVRLQQQQDAQVAQSRLLAEVLTGLDRPGTGHATLRTGAGLPVGAVVTRAAEPTVVAAGLPANDRHTSIYVLWGVGPDAAPRPVGTFDVDPGRLGPDVHRLGTTGDGHPFTGYAVSLEPGRVAPGAPGTVVASGQVRT